MQHITNTNILEYKLHGYGHSDDIQTCGCYTLETIGYKMKKYHFINIFEIHSRFNTYSHRWMLNKGGL